jgi:DNA-binding SARP family transcriptional activator
MTKRGNDAVKQASGRTGRRWWLAALVAVLVTVPATAGHAAADDELMDPNAVWVVQAFVPGAPLEKPEDARLRGYGFSAQVEGISEALAVERTFTDYKPAPGHKIVVFGVKFDRYGQRDFDRPVRGTVIVDGRRTAVDFPFNADGPLIAASVPLDVKEIRFELAAAEVAQTLSLTQRRRVGRQPVVLYRDPAAPEVVSDVNADRLVKATDDRVTASLSVTLKRVRLSWFSPPEPVTTPSSTDRAYLVLDAEAEQGDYSGDGSFEDFGTVPGSDVKLRLADGTEVEAKHAGETDDLLSGSYYFEVPADLTTATVLVGPTTVPATRRLDTLIESTRVRIEQAAFDVNLPPGNPPVRSEEEPTTTTAPGRSGSDERVSPVATDREDGGVPVWPVVVLLVLGAVALTGWRLRRRRPGETGPVVTAGEPTDLLALARDSRLALGGPGALDAVRAAVIGVGINGAGDESATVVVFAHDATAGLVPDVPAPPWLVVAPDEEALTSAVDLAHLRRARLREELEATGDSHDDAPFPEAPPVVAVVPGSVGAATLDRLLDGTAGMSSRQPITVLVVDEDASLRVETDGRLHREDDHEEAPGARVATMTVEEAATLLTVPSDDPDPEPVLAQSEGDEPEVVVLRVLGPYRITVADREVASGLRSKARELLALLAANREGITADAAMETLWPGAEPDSAYFRTVAANLRTVLRTEAGSDEPTPVVERVGQRYRLHPARVDVDLWRFEDHLAAAGRGDDEGAQAAADTYRGDLLHAEDYPWADAVRERLRRRAVDNLTALAERRRVAGDRDGARHLLERAVEHDPYSEELYRSLMRLEREAGREDAVERTFRLLEQRLAELGLTPDERSRALRHG